MAAQLTDTALKLALEGLTERFGNPYIRLVKGGFPVTPEAAELADFTACAFTGYTDKDVDYPTPVAGEDEDMIAEAPNATWVNPDAPSPGEAVVGWVAYVNNVGTFYVIAFEQYAEAFEWSYAGQSYAVELDWLAARQAP
jgi:hypothetical protein